MFTSLLCTVEGGAVRKLSCTTSVAVRSGEVEASEQAEQLRAAAGDFTRSQYWSYPAVSSHLGSSSGKDELSFFALECETGILLFLYPREAVDRLS